MSATFNVNNFLRQRFANYDAQKQAEQPALRGVVDFDLPEPAMAAVEPATTTADASTKQPDTAYKSVPAALKQETRWLVYKLVWDDKKGRNDKKPYNPLTGSPTNDSKQAVTFDVALSKVEGYSGLGFYVEPPYVVVDIDACRNATTGIIEPWVMDIVRQLDTYAEVSPSGTGVHIWLKGVKPGKACRKGIEIYSTGRFMTITGVQVVGTPNSVNDRGVSLIYERMIAGEFTEPKAQLAEQTKQTATTKQSKQIVHTGSIITNKLALLMNGTITSQKPFLIGDGGNSLQYESQSEADLALCTLLALGHDFDAAVIDSEFRKSPLYREKWNREDYSSDTIKKAIEGARRLEATKPQVLTVAGNVPASTPEVDENSEAAIPPFDPTVINGIYRDFVDLVTRGTTLNPQFAYAIAKTIVGIRMAGKVKFEDLDVEPRFYAALIGETGSGKGESWRRTYQILTAPGVMGGCGFKVINDADSGAGLKDLFFPSSPKTSMAGWNPEPVLCFVDEITTLGHKSSDIRNPGILDEMITLANSTSITRSLCARSGGNRTTDKARLAIVMCGQNGEVFMKSFAGRTKLGWYDRLTPEFGAPVEVGDLPPIDSAAAANLVLKLNSLDYSGTMRMSPDAKALLDECWNAQSPETKKKARFRSNLKLEAYMSAFGRRVKVVEAADAKVAIKIFERQLFIRRVCFTTEVPDRVGYYLGLIKRITERMVKQLADGQPPEQVAKSRRDYERMTNAHRDNEEHIFAKAWETHSRVWLQGVTIQKTNGHKYEKYLPIVEE